MHFGGENGELVNLRRTETITESVGSNGDGKFVTYVTIISVCSSISAWAGPPAVNKKKAEAARTVSALDLAHEMERLVGGAPPRLKLYRDKPPENVTPTHQAPAVGKWKAGTRYHALDVAEHPTDGSKEFVCLKQNQSNNVSVLDDARFWAPIDRGGT